MLPLITMSTLQANDPFLDDPFGDKIFKEMYQMQKEMDKIFERMHQRMEERTKHWSYPNRQSMLPSSRMAGQSVLVDKGTYYKYNTQIPENQNNQIDISIEDGVLHFKAKVDRVSKTKQEHMKVQQHYVSMIQRSEALPQDADPSSLKSAYQNGVLVLTLQKKKRLKHPLLKKKEKQAPAQATPEKEEKKETNTTKIKVPHTSSHV
jgi:HSP20 family molecular chaperone IbpA